MIYAEINHLPPVYPFNIQAINLLQYAKQNVMEMYTAEDFNKIKQYITKIVMNEKLSYWECLIAESNLHLYYNTDIWETDTVQCERCFKFLFNMCVYIKQESDSESVSFCMSCYFTRIKHLEKKRRNGIELSKFSYLLDTTNLVITLFYKINHKVSNTYHLS